MAIEVQDVRQQQFKPTLLAGYLLCQPWPESQIALDSRNVCYATAAPGGDDDDEYVKSSESNRRRIRQESIKSKRGWQSSGAQQTIIRVCYLFCTRALAKLSCQPTAQSVAGRQIGLKLADRGSLADPITTQAASQPVDPTDSS